MAKGLGCWTHNLVVLGSSTLPCHSLDLFSVATSSTQVSCVHTVVLHFTELTVVFFFFLKTYMYN